MSDQKTIQIVGPVASEYSLAKVNRNFAVALSKLKSDYAVSVFSNTEFGDREIREDDLKKYPEFKELSADIEGQPDITIFNNFPRNPNDLYGLAKLRGGVKLAYLAWEESIYPKRWVDECNAHLHGIMVTSDHIREVFRKSGIKLPIANIGGGIDQVMSGPDEQFKLETKKGFKFLHVSSAHFRKGVDILLKGYFAEFTAEDDVCLVLKLFPNPESEAEQILEKLQRPGAPEVVVIADGKLSEGQMRSLYSQCDAAVYPSRAEGFGLPMAESMFLGLPLITTGYSGQLDFCTDDNSWLLDYEMIDSKSHLAIPWSKVAEPDQKQLQKYMRYLYEHSTADEVSRKVELAKKRAQELTWKRSAEGALQFVEYSERTAKLKQQKLAVITTKNSKSGISVYTDELYGLIESSFDQVLYVANKDIADRVSEDGANVLRTWEMGETPEGMKKTITAITDFGADYVHIQYHPGEYSRGTLAALVKGLKSAGRKIFITPHAIQQEQVDFGAHVKDLGQADRIFVHSQEDIDYLAKLGFKNLQLFSYGINLYRDIPAARLRSKLNIKSEHVISSHGLIHDRKGLVQIIEALPQLRTKYPDILFLGVNALNPNNITSSQVFARMQELVKKYDLQKHVMFVTDFLDAAEVIKLLQLSDVALMPYDPLGEGSSGATRAALSASRPVVITHSHIFSNLKNVGYRIADNKHESIAAAVTRFFEDSVFYSKQKQQVQSYIQANSWEKSSREYLKNF